MLYLNKVLTREACIERYGAIDMTSLHWPEASKWIKMFEVTPNQFINWRVMSTDIPVTHIACNIDIHRPLAMALDAVINRGLQDQLFTFDGAWSIRPTRGGQLLSAHAWGLAIDINAKSNPLGGPVTISQDLAQCFIDKGFDWGAHFHRVDGMHFSRCFEGPRPQ